MCKQVLIVIHSKSLLWCNVCEFLMVQEVLQLYLNEAASSAAGYGNGK